MTAARTPCLFPRTQPEINKGKSINHPRSGSYPKEHDVTIQEARLESSQQRTVYQTGECQFVSVHELFCAGQMTGSICDDRCERLDKKELACKVCNIASLASTTALLPNLSIWTNVQLAFILRTPPRVLFQRALGGFISRSMKES